MARTLGDRFSGRDAERFVGRASELAIFETLFVDDPPASVVHVHGPGGIGKSALLRQVERLGAERGWSPWRIDGRELAPVPG
jgi:ABC-type transport system involved in cytochrome c biogenesis ATPase subunit